MLLPSRPAAVGLAELYRVFEVMMAEGTMIVEGAGSVRVQDGRARMASAWLAFAMWLLVGMPRQIWPLRVRFLRKLVPAAGSMHLNRLELVLYPLLRQLR